MPSKIALPTGKREQFEAMVKLVGFDVEPWMRSWDAASPETQAEMWKEARKSVTMERYRRRNYERWNKEVGFDVAEQMVEWEAADFVKRDALYEDMKEMMAEEHRKDRGYMRGMMGRR
jgi:hypothetical protein